MIRRRRRGPLARRRRDAGFAARDAHRPGARRRHLERGARRPVRGSLWPGEVVGPRRAPASRVAPARSSNPRHPLASRLHPSSSGDRHRSGRGEGCRRGMSSGSATARSTGAGCGAGTRCGGSASVGSASCRRRNVAPTSPTTSACVARARGAAARWSPAPVRAPDRDRARPGEAHAVPPGPGAAGADAVGARASAAHRLVVPAPGRGADPRTGKMLRD